MEREIKLHTELVIDSAHFLVGYDGLCSRPHGHSWRIRIWVKGNASQLDETGILFDFTNVKSIKDIYDHRCLNDTSPFSEKGMNPTAENIAMVIYDKLSKVLPNFQLSKEEMCCQPPVNVPKWLRFVVRVYETSVGKETWAQVGDWDEN